MARLFRFCEDVVIWASEKFKFINLAESWSTGSSIMPQKKNPDFAELIRSKSGRTTGNLVCLLTLVKGLPYAYNKALRPAACVKIRSLRGGPAFKGVRRQIRELRKKLSV
jgi:argininosuccinate lyase